MFSNSQKLSIAPVCAAFLLLGGQPHRQTFFHSKSADFAAALTVPAPRREAAKP